jgi:hypothetical protein
MANRTTESCAAGLSPATRREDRLSDGCAAAFERGVRKLEKFRKGNSGARKTERSGEGLTPS